MKELAKEGLKVDFLLLDTADEDSILRAARELKERIKVLNVLINNAAILDTWQGSILTPRPTTCATPSSRTPSGR